MVGSSKIPKREMYFDIKGNSKYGHFLKKKPPCCSSNVTRLVIQESQVRSRASPVCRIANQGPVSIRL